MACGRNTPSWSSEQEHQRALRRAILADERMHLAPAHSERNAPQGGSRAERFLNSVEGEALSHVQFVGFDGVGTFKTPLLPSFLNSASKFKVFAFSPTDSFAERSIESSLALRYNLPPFIIT